MVAKHVQQYAGQNNQEHYGGNGRAHRRVAQLELLAKERAIEERAHDVRRVIGPGQRALRGVNQIEGIEIAHVGEDGDDPDSRKDQGEFNPPKDLPAVGPVHCRGLDQLIWDADQRGVK